MAAYYIGTSGWHYEHWRYRFYPEELPRTGWLEFYSRTFNTVELNNSFYRLPSEDAFAAWRDSSPPGFTFAVKVSRYITHVKRLRDAAEAVENFVSRARALQDKLGPLLYQLPPNLPRDDARLEAFLGMLPADLKHVFEFRHDSWLTESVFDILRRHRAGFCVFDMPFAACPVVATADFGYVRFHGSAALYGSSYTDGELADWARRLADLGNGLTAVYVYFNNDVEAFAVRNAIALRRHLQEAEREARVGQ